jgi:hypothetical protein
MAENGNNVSSLNEKTLQNIQERLSSLEQGQTKILGALQALPDFINSIGGTIGKINETLSRIEANQNAHKGDIVLHRRRLNVQDERIAALENNRDA